ncbi:MAG: hypothetical protein ACJ8F3_11425 [Xanthobacteraceae bacterium]
MGTDSAVRGMLALSTAILVAGALYLARSVFTPVAFSIFAMAIVWPLQRALHAKLPKVIALLLTLLLSLGVLLLLGLAIAWGSSQVGRWLLGNLDRFQFIYARTNEWLEGHGIVVSGCSPSNLMSHGLFVSRSKPPRGSIPWLGLRCLFSPTRCWASWKLARSIGG